MKTNCTTIIFSIGLITVFNLLGAGQTRPALSVKVHTDAAVPIPGATIRIERDGGFALEGVTGEEGKVDIPSLATGQYKIRVTADGFQQTSVAVSILDVRQAVETDLTLIPEIRLSDTIDVVADNSNSTMTAAASPSAVDLRPAEMAPLPIVPSTVTDVLPLVPGVMRTSDNQIVIAGEGEQRSALLVNSSNATDPSTGRFGTTIPVDSVESVNVLQTPFLAEYGGFSSGIVSVETKRGGEKWHVSLKQPFPDFRVRSGHVRGLRDATPRVSFSGPILQDRVFFSQSVQYDMEKKQTRTLGFPHNESKDELLNSFSQLDYILSTNHFITTTLHVTPHHINFVNPQFFNPQPVSPSFRGYERSVALTEHAAVRGALLDTRFSEQQFRAGIGAQGEADMILTPLGNTGNYFARRNRTASRTEWQETLSASKGSAHASKVGSLFGWTVAEGSFDFRPIKILDATGNTMETITFSMGSPFRNADTEEAFFVQDHWSVRSNLALDGGARLEHQSITSVLRLAPRLGVVWNPFTDDPTIVRGGYGIFYDRVPLSVFTFKYRPEQTVTTYDPVRGVALSSNHFSNFLSTDVTNSFPLVRRSTGPGNFAPFSQTWTLGMERPIRKLMRLQVSYRQSRSGGGILLTPHVDNGTNLRVLSAAGESEYRQLEVTTSVSWKGGQLLFSYVRSKAQGDLNAFTNYIGDFPDVPLRPNYYSNTPGDIPNRFLAWGVINTPWKTRIAPVFEIHTGQPYAVFDARRNYVGIPYGDGTRFRNYVNLDERLSKDVRIVSKYSVRFSISVLNVFNHFNPLDVHANTADPLIGTFFGHYKRRYRADFELLF